MKCKFWISLIKTLYKASSVAKWVIRGDNWPIKSAQNGPITVMEILVRANHEPLMKKLLSEHAPEKLYITPPSPCSVLLLCLLNVSCRVLLYIFTFPPDWAHVCVTCLIYGVRLSSHFLVNPIVILIRRIIFHSLYQSYKVIFWTSQLRPIQRQLNWSTWTKPIAS